MGYFFNFNGMWKSRDANSVVVRTLITLFFDFYSLFYISSWFLIRYTRIHESPIPYLNNWLTDFAFVPLVIHFSQVLVFSIWGYAYYKVYTLGHMLLFALYVSLFFELLAPKITNYNTADWFDALAYVLGAVFYKYVHQPHLLKKK
jgi:hypothetical protein